MFVAVKEVLETFPGVPLEVDDLYWEFMVSIPKIIRKMRTLNCNRFRVWICIKFKFFCKNKCRKFSSKTHAIMNNCVSYDEESDHSHILNETICQDSEPDTLAQETTTVIDVKKLSKTQKVIYQYYFVKSLSRHRIAQKMNFTFYYVNQQIQLISKEFVQENKKVF